MGRFFLFLAFCLTRNHFGKHLCVVHKMAEWETANTIISLAEIYTFVQVNPKETQYAIQKTT